MIMVKIISAGRKLFEMNNVLKIFIPIIFLVLSWSCESDRRSAESKGSANYRWETFNKKYGGCDSLDQNCLRVFIEYPLFESDKANRHDSLNSFITKIILHPVFAGQTVRIPEDIFEQMLMEFRKFQGEFPQYPAEWELFRKVEILFNRHQIVSINFNEYMYTGGAHAGYTRLLRSFDLKTGKILSLSDFLFTEAQDSFLLSAESKFRQQKGLPKEHDLSLAGYWFPGNRFQLNDNFAFTEKGIVFYYNPYEIAPYAMGATELLLPIDEIQNFLRDKSLIKSE